MIKIRKFNDILLITVKDTVAAYNLQDLTWKNVTIQEPKVESNLTKSLEEVLKPENRKCTSLCISPDASSFAVTLQNRQLVIFDKTFTVIKNLMTKRAVNSARFTNDNNIVVADKTGDVYLYKFSEDEPQLLLGHLSMLLDVTLSECGKYIITCDRDEKIRVSRFPNSYNIVSYCLGHEEFVSNVEVHQDMLISASGDGTIRFWDFKSGRQLHAVNTNEHMDQRALQEFCKQMDDERVMVDAAPILDMQVHDNVVAVSVLGCKGVQCYKFKRTDGSVKVDFVKVDMEEEAIAFHLNKELFVLTNNKLIVYSLNSTLFQSVDLNSHTKDVLRSSNSNDVSLLYKRKFDNVREYLEKKKLRLENK